MLGTDGDSFFIYTRYARYSYLSTNKLPPAWSISATSVVAWSAIPASMLTVRSSIIDTTIPSIIISTTYSYYRHGWYRYTYRYSYRTIPTMMMRMAPRPCTYCIAYTYGHYHYQYCAYNKFRFHLL